MQDSAKGLFITITLIFIFIMAILNFITLFPSEQGVNVTLNEDENSHSFQVAQQNVVNPSPYIEGMQNDTDEGYKEWDITEGFMGSNTIKQTSKTGIKTQIGMIYYSLKSIATDLFGDNSPVIVVFGILFSAIMVIIFYYAFKWIRTGS